MAGRSLGGASRDYPQVLSQIFNGIVFSTCIVGGGDKVGSWGRPAQKLFGFGIASLDHLYFKVEYGWKYKGERDKEKKYICFESPITERQRKLKGG